MGDSLNALLQGQRAGSVLEGIAHPAVVNPLAAIQAGTQAAQHVYETRGLQAQQALGNILQQATDENGNVDYQDAQRRAAAAGPVVQMGMQSYLTNNAQLRGAQINQAGALHSMVGKWQASLIADPSDENLAKITASGHAAGLPDGGLAELARLQTLSQPERQQEALKGIGANLDALQQLQLHGNGVPFRQTGPNGNTIGGTQNMVTGAVNPAAGGQQGLPTGLDASQSAAYQQWLLAPVEAPDPANPSQMKHYATRGAYFQERGVDPAQVWPGALQGGGAPGAGTPGTQAPAPPGAPGAGAPRPATAPGGGPGPSPNKPAPVFGAGSSVSSPSQADLDAQKASTDLFNTSNANAASYQQRIFPIVQAIDLLKSGNVTTGQGADAMNAVKSRLMTVASTFGWDAQSIEQADYDKLSKYTQQYINSQGLSARSDQALASAVTGNPGSHVSTLANKDVWPVLLGMERMNQMINTDFKSQSGKPADFGNFASNWQNTHDPRAFLIDQMDGPQRTKMLASMTNEQKTAYYRTLKLVDQNPGVMLTAPMPGH